jgi:RNA polymerase sigma-70 factor (ECF subfamily)
LAEAYRRFGPTLVAVAAAALGETADDARDCVHDTLLRLWLAKDSYRPERGPLRAFLVVCVRNDALGRRRSAARRSRIDEREARLRALADADDPFDRIDPLERARLRTAVASLPVEQRRVLALAYFEGRSQREIARDLSTPLGTVKSRAALGLRALAKALGYDDHA